MIVEVNKNPEISLRIIAKDENLNPDNLHYSTVRNILKTAGFNSETKNRTFKLTEE